MRRIPHNEDWSYAPVLCSKKLYPAQLPHRMVYQPTELKACLLGAMIDVVISRQKIILLDRYGFPGGVKRNSVGRLKQISSYKVSDFIGVAVQYGPLPQGLSLPYAVSPLKFYQQFCKKTEDAVTLYLMHEERDKDILLYYATHEDEVIAQWQFWSSKLGLPQLMVGPDGFVDEPHDRLGKVLFQQTHKRSKRYGLSHRRPIFARVRDMGAQTPLRHCRGREIMARR